MRRDHYIVAHHPSYRKKVICSSTHFHFNCSVHMRSERQKWTLRHEDRLARQNPNNILSSAHSLLHSFSSCFLLSSHLSRRMAISALHLSLVEAGPHRSCLSPNAPRSWSSSSPLDGTAIPTTPSVVFALSSWAHC